ncbi:hypothetical protein K491DRAFT_599917 [Lophiostoma macrostomum CBS 122681]|uniref:SnoaL-like domain-containing protein n=1 Tax=Lophiostoma macrostomum CBS 122681 TaxID=1314788 RepID=A0A6A6T4Q5_9PLEO|nr:hypothetical protein K491DRAFT_599917 [Lophiostoma macrostomum CBS 122681]
MAVRNPLLVKLDNFYDTIKTLSSTSSPEDLDSFAAFFAEDCIAFLKSMREISTPSIGRNGVIQDFKNQLKEYTVLERREIASVVSEDGSVVISEMEHRLNVCGELLEAFPITAVVVFNGDGLITSFKHFCCLSPVVEIIQRKTGAGPYSKEFLDCCD